MISKDKATKIVTVLKVVNYVFFGGIFIISLLACVPTAKTEAEQSLFQFFGHYVNQHSQSFFLVILILCSLEFVSIAIQFYIKQSSVSTHISTIVEEMGNALKDSNHNHECMINTIHGFEIDLLKTSQFSISKIENSHFKLQMTLLETKSVYKDNLRNYYDSNKQIYDIVRNTQLSQIEDINELIDSYCKL